MHFLSELMPALLVQCHLVDYSSVIRFLVSQSVEHTRLDQACLRARFVRLGSSLTSQLSVEVAGGFNAVCSLTTQGRVSASGLAQLGSSLFVLSFSRLGSSLSVVGDSVFSGLSLSVTSASARFSGNLSVTGLTKISSVSTVSMHRE